MVDKPTIEEYGLGKERLGSNLILTAKLLFIMVAVEFIALTIFEQFGVSFEGEPTDINLAFVILAVVISPIFEETVYRVNASTLLARRFPLILVSAITSVWFIAKHMPMWYFDDNFGFEAVIVIVLVDIPLWCVVTYYFLKRNCIWIPFIVHFFNNAAIAMFIFLPDLIGVIIEIAIIVIGIIFI